MKLMLRTIEAPIAHVRKNTTKRRYSVSPGGSIVILSVPEMAVTGFVLGVVHGLWLQLAGRSSESKAHDVRLLGAISGGVLGLLAFPRILARLYHPG